MSDTALTVLHPLCISLDLQELDFDKLVPSEMEVNRAR